MKIKLVAADVQMSPREGGNLLVPWPWLGIFFLKFPGCTVQKTKMTMENNHVLIGDTYTFFKLLCNFS